LSYLTHNWGGCFFVTTFLAVITGSAAIFLLLVTEALILTFDLVVVVFLKPLLILALPFHHHIYVQLKIREKCND